MQNFVVSPETQKTHAEIVTCEIMNDNRMPKNKSISNIAYVYNHVQEYFSNNDNDNEKNANDFAVHDLGNILYAFHFEKYNGFRIMILDNEMELRIYGVKCKTKEELYELCADFDHKKVDEYNRKKILFMTKNKKAYYYDEIDDESTDDESTDDDSTDDDQKKEMDVFVQSDDDQEKEMDVFVQSDDDQEKEIDGFQWDAKLDKFDAY